MDEGASVRLGEGGTPLLASRRIGPEVGLSRLCFKVETANPTGSYKDRFAARAVSWMRQKGLHTCVATSSGNTGAALAAYCAAAGLHCRIAVVETAPMGKLMQMLAYGAEVLRVRGFGLDAEVTGRTFERLREIGGSPGHALHISAYACSFEAMQGVESIALELAEQLPEMAHVFAPAGGGGLTLAVARGLEEVGHGAAVHCAQPEGNDTIAGPLRRGEQRARAVACRTLISGLQVPSVLDGDKVIAACRASGGNGHTVSDEAVWECQRRLAREEGIFCEPAGAVALAAALQAARAGELPADAPVVCLVTGSGFKDADSIERMNEHIQVPLLNWAEL